MPVLGSVSAASGIDTSTPGVWIPNGWGSIWRPARTAHASARPEAVFFGDSTTFGQTVTGTNFSWVQQVRARSIAAGYTDGGYGGVNLNDIASLTAPDNLAPLVSAGPFVQSDADNVMGVAGWMASAAGTITFQFKGTAARIWYSKRDSSNAAQFTYAVDGGSTTAVDTTSTALTYGLAYVSGLTEGTHTITVTYTGGTGVLAITPEFLRSTGIVYQKQAISGVSSNTWFSPSSTTNYRTTAALGLDPGVGGSTPIWQRAKSATTGARNVKLAGFHIGTNDLQSSTSATDASARADALANSIGIFAEACKTAGADAFLVIPPYWATSQANPYMGVFRQRHLAAGLAFGLAVVDADAALGGYANAQANAYGGASGNPHLTQAGYTALGNVVFDQLINR